VVRSGIDNDDLPDEGNLDEVSMESLFASELKRREIAPGEDEVSNQNAEAKEGELCFRFHLHPPQLIN